MMPGLGRMLGDFTVPGLIKIRPADLCVTDGHLQPGIVLIGDAFSTSCPAAGTGTTKVFTDVGRLCNIHIPNWLATEGMDLSKIRKFYEDPEKSACELQSLAKAYHLRSLSIDGGLGWHVGRLGRFAVRFAQGLQYAARRRLSPSRSDDPNDLTLGEPPRHRRLA